jgi:hypothetical protein
MGSPNTGSAATAGFSAETSATGSSLRQHFKSKQMSAKLKKDELLQQQSKGFFATIEHKHEVLRIPTKLRYSNLTISSHK